MGPRCPRCEHDFRAVLEEHQLEELEAHGTALSRRVPAQPICWLCGKAEALADFLNRGGAQDLITDEMARIAIQNEYEENRRLPATSQPIGLGWVPPAECARRGRSLA